MKDRARCTTPEFKAKTNERQNARRASLPAEELERLNAKQREKYQSLSPEDRVKRLAYCSENNKRPEAKQRAKERQKVRRSTPEGRANKQLWNSSYKKSPRGRETEKRYRQSETGRLTNQVKGHRRRVRLRAGNLTRKQWQSVLVANDKRCIYCLCADRKLEIDHVKAIALGGTHSIGNVVPACGNCNRLKGDLELTSALTKLGVNHLDYLMRRAVANLRL